MKTGSYITFKYIFRLFLDWLKGNCRLEPMSNFQIISFIEKSNFHIFHRDKKESLCGKISKNESSVLSQSLNFTIKDMRLHTATLANEGDRICGQCVAGLYSDSEEAS